MYQRLGALWSLGLCVLLAGCAAATAPPPTADVAPATDGAVQSTATPTGTAVPTETPPPTATPTLALPATPTPNPNLTPPPVELPLPLVVTGAEGVTLSSVCLTTTTAYAVAQPLNAPPLAEATGEALRAVGVEVRQPGKPCDADLTINWTLTAVSALYEREGAQYTCYTGADVQARVALSAGEVDHAGVITADMPPPSETGICREANAVPYYEVWPITLLELLHELWGTPALFAVIDAPPLEYELQNKLVELFEVSQPFTDEGETLLTPDQRVLLLFHAASSDQLAVRSMASYALNGLGETREVVAVLIDGMSHEDRDVRAIAASKLGSFVHYAPESWTEGAVPALLYAALYDPEPGVRERAVLSLGESGQASDTVIAALEEVAGTDRNLMVRANAAYALTRLGADVEAAAFVPGLIDDLADVEGAEEITLSDLLRRITGEEYQTADEWRAWLEDRPSGGAD